MGYTTIPIMCLGKSIRSSNWLPMFIGKVNTLSSISLTAGYQVLLIYSHPPFIDTPLPGSQIHTVNPLLTTKLYGFWGVFNIMGLYGIITYYNIPSMKGHLPFFSTGFHMFLHLFWRLPSQLGRFWFFCVEFAQMGCFHSEINHMGVSINGDPPIAGWFVSWKIRKWNRTSCCGDAGGPENTWCCSGTETMQMIWGHPHYFENL